MKLKLKLKTNWNFLADLKLWQKFFLLGLLVLPMVGLPTYYYLEKTRAEVELVNREIAGISSVSASVHLLNHVQQHEAVSASFLVSANEGGERLEQVQGRVQALIANLERDPVFAADGRISGLLADIKAQWTSLSQLIKSRSLDPETAFSDHGELGRKVLALSELLLDHFGLTLDPDEHTAVLIRNAYVDLPALTEPLARLRTFGATQILRAEIRKADPKAPAAASPDRTVLASYMADAYARIEAYGRGITKVLAASPALKELLEAGARDNIRAGNRLVDLAKSGGLDSAQPTVEVTEFTDAYNKGIEGFYAQLDQTSKALEGELRARQDRLQRAIAYTGMEIGLLFLGCGLFGFFIVRNVTSTVHALQVAVDKVRSGDETGLANITGRDEIGSLGRTVNVLLQDRIAAQKKAEEENAQLNQSVIGLMQTVYQLSNRDLTAHANVDESVIGTVASSINQFAGETGKVLGQVSRIAGNVDRASAQVKAQAERVHQTARNEREEVSKMVDDISSAVSHMNLIATLAGNTNEAAASATQATNAALERVSETVAGMEGIRETIAETEKRIKRLGERSQEISGIVNLINTIAERTHVLALNAAMQAAIAGDAGRGFAVVAEEVQRLAESSRNATSQIATLINNIQLETNETIGTVNRTISQVVDGSELARRAGDQMRETQRIAANLAGLVQRIAEGTDAQNKVASELRNRISDIGRSSEQTSQQIEEQAAETAALAEAARQLNSAISVFKLPRQVLDSETGARPPVTRSPMPAAA